MHRNSTYGKSRMQKARARAGYRARQLRRAQRAAAANDMTAQRTGRWTVWSGVAAVWRGIMKTMRVCKITVYETSH